MFYCHPTPYLGRRDFEELFEPHKADFVTEYGIGHFESIDLLLQVLYAVGFLGVIHKDRVLYESLGDKFILSYAMDLLVHPAFRDGLNIPEPETKPAATVFDQRGQMVSSQINVAGSYIFVRPDSELVNVLFLSANPTDTSRLRLDEEMRAIDRALRQSKFRDKFRIKTHWAVRIADLQTYLLRYEPDIVHFSGHGSRSGEIVLENDLGQSQPVSIYTLGQIFSVLKHNVRCVILDACYSKEAAQAIAENIDCVIGISRTVRDSAATSFVAAFYQALAHGKDIKTAFELGCLQITLKNLVGSDSFKLLAIKSKPEEIVFVQ